VRLLQKEFQIKLRNIYSFLTIYANIDGFSPAQGSESTAEPVWKAIERSRAYTDVRSRSLLDRWILSEVQLVAGAVVKALDSFQVYEAAQALVAVVDALSNWYLRRSRNRFWAAGLEQDKLDGYFTLYEALTSIIGLAAPFIPFFAEEVYQNLVCRAWPSSQAESIHLCPYPEPKPHLIDAALSLEMQLVRELASLGLRVRTDAKLKVRQPLKSAEIILARQDLTQRVSGYRNLIADELNVAEVHFHSSGYEGLGYRIRLNLPLVGRRLGSLLPRVREVLASTDARSLVRQLDEQQRVVLQVDGKEHVFSKEEVEVFAEAPSGFAAASSSAGVVLLKTELTEELIDEGLVRELLAHLQSARRQLALGYSDRIVLAIDGTERIRRVSHQRAELVSRETLATELIVGPPAFSPEWTQEVDVNGHPARLSLARASSK
jgi:isoleucyl-tRNA synthetase